MSPERLRMLHVSSGNLYGGVEAILVTLASFRHLCPAMEPHFALSFEGRLSQELIECGVPVYVLGKVRVSRPWTVWRTRRRLSRLLSREQFDFVVCHMPWSLAIFGGVAQAKGLSLAFWAHGLHSGRHWLERWACRTKPDLAIANSHFTSNAFPHLFPQIRSGVIYPPVALDTQRKSGYHRGDARQELQVPEDTVVIIQVSRLESWKGHLLHLRALSLLKNLNIPWVCWMVGGAQRIEEADYLKQIQQAASDLGVSDRVRFLGARGDVPRLLKAADIFCQPNQQPEPFGIVFIEALAAGLPIVTTAMGGALEIVDESCGLLVQPDDVAALAQSLTQLIESPELPMMLGQAGPARARELCDPGMQMARLSELARSAVIHRESNPS